jgi:hypothetical protein
VAMIGIEGRDESPAMRLAVGNMRVSSMTFRRFSEENTGTFSLHAGAVVTN